MPWVCIFDSKDFPEWEDRELFLCIKCSRPMTIREYHAGGICPKCGFKN